MKTKLYQKIVANKAFTAVNELKIKKDRINCSAKILDVLQQNPSVQQAVLLQKSRKKLYNSLLYALSKQSTKSPTASEKETAGLKKKQNTGPRAGPNPNSTSNNNKKSKDNETIKKATPVTKTPASQINLLQPSLRDANDHKHSGDRTASNKRKSPTIPSKKKKIKPNESDLKPPSATPPTKVPKGPKYMGREENYFSSLASI